MISLERQFQSIVLSFSFGMFFIFIYSIFDYLFSKYKWFVRLPFESVLFLTMTSIFFKLNVYVNEGLLNIYIPLFMIIGFLIYIKFYRKYIIKILNNVCLFVKHKITDKLVVEFKKIYGIIKNKKRVKKNAKKQQGRSGSLESKQSRQYSYDWSFFNRDYDDD